MMPSLLFLTQRIPYPPNKGEKTRTLQFLQHFRRSYDVHLGCLVDDRRDDTHMGTVRALCASAYFAKLDRRRAKITCLSGLLTGEPLSVTFYRDRGLADWVRQTMRTVRPEVMFVCSSNMAPYVLDLRGSERVFVADLVDVDSEKWRAYAEVSQFPMRQVHAREARLVAELEERTVRECDWATFVSLPEAAVFARMFPQHAAKLRAVPTGVDSTYFDPAADYPCPYDPALPAYVFTGTMDYKPNVDAVVWFAHAILPLIRRTQPEAQFVVVGSNPAPEVRALAAEPGVLVTGRVADVRPYLAHAAAAVAPMRIARGIQTKVLEAMSMARPVVVTPDALEGIEATPEEDVLLAEDAEAFAASCLRAGEPGAEALGAAARRLILAKYDWTQTPRGFDPLLDAAA